MQVLKTYNCPACKSHKNEFYISTNALMHKANNEKYNFNKCQLCDSVFLTNPVSESVLNKYYTEHYLPYQGEKAWGKFKSFVARSQKALDKRRLKIVTQLTKNNSTFSLLDIGCGNPSFLAMVKKELHVDCTGIDFSDEGWKDKNFKELNLFKTSISDFKPQKKYDVITLWHYLEHDYHLQETIEQLYQLLKTDGKIIIEVPNYKSTSAYFQKEYWQGWHSPRHITLFSKKGFLKLFNHHQWTLVKHQNFGTLDAFTLWWLGRMEKKKCNWAGNMEHEFWPLVGLKVLTLPFFLFEKFIPMGIQTIIFKKNKTNHESNNN